MKFAVTAALAVALALVVLVSVDPFGEGTAAGAAQPREQGRVQRDAQGKPFQGWSHASKRGCTRMWYYHRTEDPAQPWGDAPGHVVIEYGLADWKPGILDRLDSATHRRWRLGVNHWTNLDTTAPITIGGQKIAPGYYYLVLDGTNRERWKLGILRPDDVAAKGLDAWHTTRRELPPATLVPLEHTETPDVARQLDMQLRIDARDATTAELVIRFGPHRLSAPVVVEL